MILVLPAVAQRSDSLKAVLDSVFANPIYRWDEVTPTLSPLARLWRQLTTWVYDLQQRNPDAFRALFWLLVALLALILLHAAYTAWRTMRWATASDNGGGVAAIRVRDAAWFAAETRRLAGEGRFAEAIQADFVRLMLELHDKQVVKFHPSKTPAEFARDAPSEQTRERLTNLVRTLYRYAFAREACGPAEFAEWTSQTHADRYAAAH